ncbi:folylpolyglutamate synthase/dihydrofolate synthase family protein [Desulfopila sp. IMCC35008]|uniref:bifunctional folylpolyglutamate synthase/dihydrofolate synthase n=1 Tax=Desulfopila sp. IMCC35008 TaxID=2653858 RepID=UPI0013D1E65D|nr:folylpolyglutamate synthase/dihydrofolate synthase family protein [Desulfopila sp. IMCC35008]
MNFNEAIVFLDNLQLHKIKLGLEAMRSFLARVDQPDRKLRFIHVAGTNGKGSVSVSLLTVLREAGYRVGLYTSPHLSNVRERFRVNEDYISEEAFARHASRIVEALGEDTITYFEFTTALAMLWFAESDLDVVILETGLGGRMDATNVVLPMVSVITSISMDHEAYLGTTIAEVAGEKAGIIKENIPVVAAGGGREIIDVLTGKAAECNAPLYLLGREFSYSGQSNDNWDWKSGAIQLGEDVTGLQCTMRGAYQRENGSLCLATLKLLAKHGFEVSGEQIRKGLTKVRWPGRLEYLVLDRLNREQLPVGSAAGERHVRYLLDGAHNPEGVKNMSMTLANEYSYRHIVLVWGAMIDKDIGAGLREVLPLADTVILTRPEGERSAEPEQLAACLPEDSGVEVFLERDVAKALSQAEQLATEEDLIVVAGSLYLVGAVRADLVGQLVDQ